jgi:hypothetical protein
MKAGARVRLGGVDAALLILSAIGPACLAASRVGNAADAAHDAGVARVLGLDAQPWRALDVLAESPLVAMPLGTRAARAAMGGAMVASVAGVALYQLARELLRRSGSASVIGLAVACVAALSAVLSPRLAAASRRRRRRGYGHPRPASTRLRGP